MFEKLFLQRILESTDLDLSALPFDQAQGMTLNCINTVFHIFIVTGGLSILVASQRFCILGIPIPEGFSKPYFGIGPRQNRDPGIPPVLRNNVILGHSTHKLRKAANIRLWLRANHYSLMLIRV